MSIRTLFRSVTVLTLCILPFVGHDARANALHAQIGTQVEDDLGTNSGTFLLTLNGMELPVVEMQTVALHPGDTLRADVSVFASTESNEPSNRAHNVFIMLTLDPGTESAVIQTNFRGTATAAGTINTASIANSHICLIPQGCALDGAPSSMPAGFIAALSDTTIGNQIIIDNVMMPTGRTGGPEELALDYLVNLDRGPAVFGDPTVNLTVNAVAQSNELGSASGSAVLELTIVPIPAAVWLFGSALALLGWLRRRTSA